MHLLWIPKLESKFLLKFLGMACSHVRNLLLCRSKPSESQCYKVAPDTLQDNILGVHIASAKSKEKALGNCSENALHYLLNIAISARGDNLFNFFQLNLLPTMIAICKADFSPFFKLVRFMIELERVANG